MRKMPGKITGLKQRLFLDGMDFSGDVGTINNLNLTRSLIDVTAIDKEVMERLPGIGDLEMSYKTFFNNEPASINKFLEDRITSDEETNVVWMITPNLAFIFDGVVPSYNVSRNDDGSLECTSAFNISNGLLGRWPNVVTDGYQDLRMADSPDSTDLGDFTREINFTAASYPNRREWGILQSNSRIMRFAVNATDEAFMDAAFRPGFKLQITKANNDVIGFEFTEVRPVHITSANVKIYEGRFTIYHGDIADFGVGTQGEAEGIAVHADPIHVSEFLEDESGFKLTVIVDPPDVPANLTGFEVWGINYQPSGGAIVRDWTSLGDIVIPNPITGPFIAEFEEDDFNGLAGADLYLEVDGNNPFSGGKILALLEAL